VTLGSLRSEWQQASAGSMSFWLVGYPCQCDICRGGTGTGKTLIGLHFLVEGARKGEPGILFTLEETPEQLRGIAHNFGGT
jgi:hypothetical protein